MHLDLTKIGAFIHKNRKEQALTQAELGERLGVSAQSVSNWERGEALPDVSILPDLAGILRCSVDAILLGGEGCIAYRRHVTVAQVREALRAIGHVGEALGRDHFAYECMIDALNARMNTTIDQAFTDPHIEEVFVIEFLLGCLNSGDYIDPRDVKMHLQDSRARSVLLDALRQKGYQ